MSFTSISVRGLGALVALAALAAALAAPGLAFAHVTANPSQGPANGYMASSFRVGHGCEGSPTIAVRVKIPDGVISVKPQLKPGWDIEIVTGPLAEPVENHGQTITEGVTEVIWRGGPLPDENYDDFGISMKMPDAPGETLYFPVVQECEEGESAWIEIPQEGGDEPDYPAPGITLAASSGDGHGSADASADEQASTDDDDDGVSTVTIAALAIGALGLVAGGGSFLYSWRRNGQ